MWVPVAMWQVRLRTAISVYFTLLRTYCGDVYNGTTVPGKLRASPGRPLHVATPVPRQPPDVHGNFWFTGHRRRCRRIRRNSVVNARLKSPNATRRRCLRLCRPIYIHPKQRLWLFGAMLQIDPRYVTYAEVLDSSFIFDTALCACQQHLGFAVH